MQASLGAFGRLRASTTSGSSSSRSRGLPTPQQPHTQQLCGAASALPRHQWAAGSWGHAAPCPAHTAHKQQQQPDRQQRLSTAGARRRPGSSDAGFPDESSLQGGGQPLDEFAEAPLDDASVRERQHMAAQAGPSSLPAAAGGVIVAAAAAGAEFGAANDDAAAAAAAAADDGDEEGEEGEEVEDDSPFPEPEPHLMLLCDLLGRAAEVEAAALVEEGFPDVVVAGICDDPASVLRGDLYCCIETVGPNELFDGHDPEAVAAALAAGATALLANRGVQWPAGLVPDSVPVIYADDVDELAARLAAVLYGEPASGLTLVAVSGSSGKTTASWLIRGVLEQVGQLTGMVGSIEHALAEHLLSPDGSLWVPSEADAAEGRECASPWHLVPYRGRYCVEETTPSGLRVQKLLAGMRDRGATAAVLEASTEAAASGCLEWVRPSIAVFTNFEPDDPHARFVCDTKEEHLEAMLQQFRGLTDAGSQRAVVNIDDPAGPSVAAAAARVPCITYGIDNAAADVRVVDLQLTLWRTTMIVATPEGRVEIITNLIGRHNVYNVLAAVAVGVQLGLPLADIGAGVESVQFVPGRCEVVNNNDLDLLDPEEQQQQQQEAQPPQAAVQQLPQDFAVVVDAADTPRRLGDVLTSLREAGAKRVFTVFGCDGQVTTGEMRARMGEVAHQRSDFVILTMTSPGMEQPPDIVQDIVSGWPNELFEPYAAYVYPVFQDQTHAPLWFEPFLHSAQRRWRRHIMEDRFQAIRAAIGTAAPGDVVLLAGRGHKDWTDWGDGEGGLIRGWFDDRVEARNALAKLEYLYSLVDVDRSALPWGTGEEAKSVVEIE